MTIVSEKQQLLEIINEAVQELFERELPNLLRRAKRKPWLTTEDLKELTGWSTRKCQYLRDEKRIPFFQEGRTILYPTAEIEAYLEENLINPRGED